MHCDVKQFVNTTDPIWTYKTTNDGEVICEVDEMESITQVDFLFRKLFLMRRRRFEVPLRGQFYHFQPDRMTITSRDMTPMCTEILLYMARDRWCEQQIPDFTGYGGRQTADYVVVFREVSGDSSGCELRFHFYEPKCGVRSSKKGQLTVD
ncbi:hypothetical protein MRX96_055401 [Rhipicephalus microplus]